MTPVRAQVVSSAPHLLTSHKPHLLTSPTNFPSLFPPPTSNLSSSAQTVSTPGWERDHLGATTEKANYIVGLETFTSEIQRDRAV